MAIPLLAPLAGAGSGLAVCGAKKIYDRLRTSEEQRRTQPPRTWSEDIAEASRYAAVGAIPFAPPGTVPGIVAVSAGLTAYARPTGETVFAAAAAGTAAALRLPVFTHGPVHVPVEPRGHVAQGMHVHAAHAHHPVPAPHPGELADAVTLHHGHDAGDHPWLPPPPDGMTVPWRGPGPDPTTPPWLPPAGDPHPAPEPPSHAAPPAQHEVPVSEHSVAHAVPSHELAPPLDLPDGYQEMPYERLPDGSKVYALGAPHDDVPLAPAQSPSGAPYASHREALHVDAGAAPLPPASDHQEAPYETLPDGSREYSIPNPPVPAPMTQGGLPGGALEEHGPLHPGDLPPLMPPPGQLPPPPPQSTTDAAFEEAGVAAMGGSGAAVGAAIGSAICPGVGTAVGAFVGGIIGTGLGAMWRSSRH